MKTVMNRTARRDVADRLTEHAIRVLGRGEATCLAVVEDPVVAGTYLGLMEDPDGRWTMLLVGREVVGDHLKAAEFYASGGLLAEPVLSV